MDLILPSFDIHIFSRRRDQLKFIQDASVFIFVNVVSVCVLAFILLPCNFEHESFPYINVSFFQTLSWKDTMLGQISGLCVKDGGG